MITPTDFGGAVPNAQPALTLPFTLRGYRGTVAISYTENQDASAWGFDVPGLVARPFDLTLALGFPVFQATVEYAGPGYRALMGWIQVITRRDLSSGAEEVSVDLAPIFDGMDSPFCFFGHAPTLFDAPANPGDAPHIWIAESFLAVCPSVARTRQVAALVGARWGYSLLDGRAQPLPLEPIAADAWNHHLAYLSAQYPSWEFLADFAANL